MRAGRHGWESGVSGQGLLSTAEPLFAADPTNRPSAAPPPSESMQKTASPRAFVETLSFDDPALANALFGPHNAHLNAIAERTGADLSTRGATLAVASDDPELRERILNLFTQFYGLLRGGHALQSSDLEQGLQLLESDPGSDLRRSFRDEAVLSLPKKTVTARNAAQRAYLETLRSNEMVFSVGPAGTGKTYLAVAMAVHMLNARRVRRIILTRPAVEAGEKLGFLPGDLAEKVNPYLRPLHDALLDMLGPQKMASLQETGIIEVAPLAFMRGRTLNDAFIILDEAQNTTREQMKMFLTRLGFGSRAVITGDVTQIDLPAQGEDNTARSGLVHALHVLKGVKGVAFRHFTSADVVRHPLVGRIVQAYDDYEKLPASHQ